MPGAAPVLGAGDGSLEGSLSFFSGLNSFSGVGAFGGGGSISENSSLSDSLSLRFLAETGQGLYAPGEPDPGDFLALSFLALSSASLSVHANGSYNSPEVFGSAPLPSSVGLPPCVLPLYPVEPVFS